MHTWYVSIIMQFYLIFPLLFALTKRFSKNIERTFPRVLLLIFVCSLVLYISPLTSDEQDFYLLPSRLFEFAAGGLLACTSREYISQNKKILLFCWVLFLFMFLGLNIDAVKLSLITMVAVSSSLLYIITKEKFDFQSRFLKYVAFLGTASYSLYLCHQVIFAYFFKLSSAIFPDSLYSTVGVILFAFIVGVFFYYVVEKPLGFLSNSMKKRKYINLVCAMLAIVFVLISTKIYFSNGVVCDIPEFEIVKSSPYQYIPKKYNDANYQLDKDFPSNGKKNILVIGDSFGRDWMNILIESGVNKAMNLSYHMDDDSVAIVRVAKADVIFLANDDFFSKEYALVTPFLIGKNFYRIGTKGAIWNPNYLYAFKRKTKEYYQTKVIPNDKFQIITNAEKRIYGRRFIDLMSYIKDSDGKVPLFSPNKKFILVDGGHLTREGAKFLAKRINVWRYLPS